MNRQADQFSNHIVEDLEPIRPTRMRATLERRQISKRWLTGSVLTGVVSAGLMGGALITALEGLQQLTIPALAHQGLAHQGLAHQGEKQNANENAGVTKGARLVTDLIVSDPADTQIIMVSTISRDNNEGVVRKKPFLFASSPLAATPKKKWTYPGFDPLTILSRNDAIAAVTSSEAIYGAEVEGEVRIQNEPFPHNSEKISIVLRQNASDIERVVRATLPELDIGATAHQTLSYFDTSRFASQDPLSLPPSDVTITAENMTVLTRNRIEAYQGIRYEERMATMRSTAPIKLALLGEGLDEAEAANLTDILALKLTSDSFVAGDMLRMSHEISIDDDQDTPAKPSRFSLYRSGKHLFTLVRQTGGSYVSGKEPEKLEQTDREKNWQPLLSRANLPNVYNAIYRSAMNEGLTAKLAGNLVKIFSYDVDFKSTVKRDDQLAVLLSLEEGATNAQDIQAAEQATEGAEILYASIQLGKRMLKYYRFVDPKTGKIDYFDETGKSAKQFLLRQPVPNGKFRSPYGMRRHPITGVRKMHTGVDWSAPRGTPIIAPGNGVVEKAGWAGGYGRQTILRHANGYKTSYSHQTRFAKGIAPGIRVRQGQVIGYVGSTGLSTGPHLHYEVFVNGNRVNPMRIKMRHGKVLKGKQLEAFEAERTRIDLVLKKREENNRKTAGL